MKMWIYVKSITPMCLAIFAYACSTSSVGTPTPQVPDLSLVSATTCTPPCWQGLALGKSSWEEVLDFVKNDSLIAGNYDTSLPVEKTGIRWWWSGEKQDTNRSNLFIFTSNVLVEIDLVPNSDITLTSILNTIGAPEKAITAGRCFAEGGGARGYDLKLFYLKLGVVISWKYDDQNIPNCPDPMIVCPEPDQPAAEITYYTLELAQSESDRYQVGVSNNLGWAVYAGSDLAKPDNGTWAVNCLRIGK